MSLKIVVRFLQYSVQIALPAYENQFFPLLKTLLKPLAKLFMQPNKMFGGLNFEGLEKI